MSKDERVLDVRALGAYGDGIHDDTAVIQKAIQSQQDTTSNAAEVYIPAGTYLISSVLTCAPRGTTTDSTLPLVIRGDGMHATILQATTTFASNGLLGYKLGVGNAQVICSDLTLDGNYSGVDSGSIAQTANTALFASVVPYNSPNSNNVAPTGVYNQFRRVRFYRPPGYTFQPTRSADIRGCVFDSVGQPDLASGATHYDTLGSGGYTDAIVIGNSWVDSSGNYADFIDTTGTKALRCTFIGNTSQNHQIGGVYVLGDGSIVTGNRLFNTTAGSYIGYDSGSSGNRARNIVAENVCPNIKVYTGADPGSQTYGDIVRNNLSADGRSTDSLKPTAAIGETVPRSVANLNASISLTSGTLFLVGVDIPIGQTVTSITWRSGGTGITGGTHGWSALFDSGRNVLRQSTDDTSVAWSSGSLKTFTLSSTFTTTYSGLHYIGVMIAAGTPPTLTGINTQTNVEALAPVLTGTSDAGLTGTAPTTAAAISGALCRPYAYWS